MTATNEDVKAELVKQGADCAACAWKDSSGASWGPIISWTGAMGMSATVNTSSIYEANGMSEKCAGTFNNIFDCADAACAVAADNCDAAGQTACFQNVLGANGVCTTEFAKDEMANCVAADQTAYTAGQAALKKLTYMVSVSKFIKITCGTP
jgi:hypothetical protein